MKFKTIFTLSKFIFLFATIAISIGISLYHFSASPHPHSFESPMGFFDEHLSYILITTAAIVLTFRTWQKVLGHFRKKRMAQLMKRTETLSDLPIQEFLDGFPKVVFNIQYYELLYESADIVDLLFNRSYDALTDLKAVNDQLNQVLDTIRESIFVIREDLTIAHANESAKKLRNLVSLEGLKIDEVMNVVEEDKLKFSRALGDSFQLTIAHDIDVQIGKRSFTVSMRPTQFKDKALLIIALRDTTKEKKLTDVRKDFIANASHELKTPVAALGLLMESIKRSIESGDGEHHNLIKKSQASVQTLQKKLQDILNLSKIESPDHLGEPSTVNIFLMINDLIEEYKLIAESKGIKIELLSMYKGVEISGHPEELALLFKNLIENAIVYGKKNGSLRIKISQKGLTTSIAFTDDGQGIPTEEQTRIFERFYRVDQGRSGELQSTGLGLSIVKHVLKNHAGRIYLTSKLGVGSEFIVKLPNNFTSLHK